MSDNEVSVLASGGDVKNGRVRQWTVDDSIDTGTAQGGTSFVPGLRGKAIQFDGKTGYIDSDPLKPAKTVSVSAFVNLKKAGATGFAAVPGCSKEDAPKGADRQAKEERAAKQAALAEEAAKAAKAQAAAPREDAEIIALAELSK